ncbi:L,D-transpeptidase family protein [Paenibacillus solanacearum]|uniref:L,D-transpeptidase family protein n=1 Tax=Paenibacillus solanacearum TaxID=2048548 RepID=UPI001FE71A87|nr:L,D-transpeptidase [Paenibacillus solanacearum]
MKTKPTGEQLELFFKQDPMYLKKYVKAHPENKMAWYLLGRDYESQGKQGKALYCYAQAGEIYEAYENQKISLPTEELESIERWHAGRKRARTRGVLRWAVLLLLAAASVLIAPGSWPWTPEETSRELPLPPDVSSAQVRETKVYYLSGGKSKASVGAALQQMLLQERVSSFGLLARGLPLGGTSWIGWLKKPQLILSVEAKQDASQQQIYYHDAQSCECEPSDSAKAEAIVDAWMSTQEQELVLKSALAAYMERNGRMPQQSSELTAAYPNNMLPGLTPYMQERFERQKDALGAELAAAKQASAAGAKALPEAGTDGLTKPLGEPMRIIVDKTAHRLAVASGNIIVRSYAVGLGGSRTPEGTFAISEKVRNPNGKSDGEFGSRGMTLSDTNYAIHGTNKPSSIGKDQSLGCIRMRKEDIEELFDLVPLGTPVTIGKGMLPLEEVRSGKPYQVPAVSDDTNPGKVYRWLD